MVSVVQVLLAVKTYKLQRFLDLSTVSPSQVIIEEDGVTQENVLLAVKTYKLQRFLDLSTVSPSQVIIEEDGVTQENVEFTRFEQQDSTIASWLLSLVSQSVLPHLIGLDTSAQIWNAIVSLYGSKTTSRLMFYRRALHSQRKGDLTMKEFLMKIKSYCDNLASCREIISECEHVTAILNGLPSEYESVISIIVANQLPYSVQNVTTMLIDTEAQQQVIMTEVPTLANLVSQQESNSDSNSCSSSYRPFTTRGRGHGRSSKGRVQCQLCGKMGHLVDRCYHRFDASYKSMGYRSPPQANVCVYGPGSSLWIPPSVPMMPPMVPLSPVTWPPSPGWSYQATPTPSWTNLFVGNLMQPVTPSTSAAPLSNTFLTTAETVGDNAWYPDFGATYHLTHSVSNIGDSLSHSGPGKVYVGNGNALPVLCSGQSSLLTRSRPLYMKSLLFSPGITKNLLSVSKFTRDNQVMFEFLPTQCQVRDLKIREVLLHGSVHYGLYKLYLPAAAEHDQVPPNAHCFTASAQIPFNIWGPASITSNKFQYYVAFNDAYTRYTWVYFLRRKFEYLTQHRITKRLTCPYTSAQNGLVERKHCQIVETGFFMLAHASMPITYWNVPSAGLFIFSTGLITIINFYFSLPLVPSWVTHLFIKGIGVKLAMSITLCQPPITSLPNSPTPTHSNSNSQTSHLPLSSSIVYIQPFPNASSSLVPTQPTVSIPTTVPHNSHAMITRSKAGIFKPKAYLSIMPCSDIPADIHAAMEHKCWVDAVHAELQDLERNNTWTLYP
ncbi:uncharacterized protein LOC108481406 [Gossypium arboreum]|uniref:uncharacterized protein LOC108481406 n=1 Tax=Gossypium arboreum TaxID=29729 RepID=UPI0022F17E49|nr:uncharacterized protein LOC108481406 [Gossypium arboreum]